MGGGGGGPLAAARAVDEVDTSSALNGPSYGAQPRVLIHHPATGSPAAFAAATHPRIACNRGPTVAAASARRGARPLTLTGLAAAAAAFARRLPRTPPRRLPPPHTHALRILALSQLLAAAAARHAQAAAGAPRVLATWNGCLTLLKGQSNADQNLVKDW